MYAVKVIDWFSAAHYLNNYKGKCESLHGHNWKVEVVVAAEKLDDRGMVIDFIELRKLLKEIIGNLDHKCINEEPFFKNKNTTSEVIAFYIYSKLKEKIETKNKAFVKEVAVWEQERSCAIYKPDSDDGKKV